MRGGDNPFAGLLPFVAVADTLSFRAAAARLGHTPSGVSKAVARLEQDLGVRLLHRTSRSVSLTPDGQAYLRACRDVLEGMRAARARVSLGARSVRGRVVVSVPLILGQELVLPSLGPLARSHPQLTVDVRITDRYVNLADEGVDVALRIGELDALGHIVRRLGRVRWCTVAAPAYLARHGRPAHPRELAAHLCLGFVAPRGTLKPWYFVEPHDGSAIQLLPSAPLRADHGAALIHAAAAGAGLFQAHHYAVRERLARGELVEVLGEYGAPGPELGLVRAPSARRSPRVRVVVEHLARLLAEPARPAPEAAPPT